MGCSGRCRGRAARAPLYLLQLYIAPMLLWMGKFKNVFGAVGLFVDGRIFASSGKFGIALRLPEEVLTDLFQNKRAKRLKYFAKGRIKKEYAVIPPRILRRQREIRSLVHKSVRYTVSLPK